MPDALAESNELNCYASHNSGWSTKTGDKINWLCQLEITHIGTEKGRFRATSFGLLQHRWVQIQPLTFKTRLQEMGMWGPLPHPRSRCVFPIAENVIKTEDGLALPWVVNFGAEQVIIVDRSVYSECVAI